MTGPRPDTLPDFSGLFQDTSPAPTVSQEPPASKAATAPVDGMPNFGDLFTDRAKSPRDVAVDQARKIKSDFYESIGLKSGALRGVIDIIPEAYLKVMGTDFEDVTGALKGTAQNIGQFASSAVDDPAGAVKTMAKGAIDGVVVPFVQHPVELMLNEHIAMDATIQWQDGKITAGGEALTAEDREERGKNVASNIIGWVIGAKVAGAVEAGIVGQEAITGAKGLAKVEKAIAAGTQAGGMATEAGRGIIVDGFSQLDRPALWHLRDGVMPKPFRGAIAGSVGGAAGGFSMGYAEGQDSKEALQAGMAYAALAMPIGVAMESFSMIRELAKPTGDMAASVAYHANQVWNLRQLQFATDQPPGEMLFNLNNLAEGQSLAASLAVKSIDYRIIGQDKNGMDIKYGANATVIPTDNPMELMRLVTERSTEDAPIATAVHTRADGMHEVVVAPADMPQAELDFFSKTGYLHGQQVGYGGSDSWVIESISPKPTDARRGYSMELRNLVTDERVQNVKRGDLTRLNSDAPGDLRIHMGRTITGADIYDPGQGFAMYGENGMGKYTYDVEGIREAFAQDVSQYAGAELRPIFGESTVDIQALRAEQQAIQEKWVENGKLTPEEAKRAGELTQLIMQGEEPVIGYKIDGQELKPGMNKFSVVDEDTGMEHGMIVYMGGATERAPGPPGARPIDIPVGKPGHIVSYMTWATERSGTGQPLRGSTNFWSAHDSPNRQIGSRAIVKEAADMGLNRSLSSLSEGGSRSLQNRRNFYNRDRMDASNLTIYTGKSLETHIIEDFLDHVGATADGRYRLTPDEILAYRGWEGQYQNTVGRRGDTLETIRGRLTENRVTRLEERDVPRTFTESKKPLSDEEVSEQIQMQLRSDAVPTIRKEADRLIDRTEMSWHDLVTSYAKARGVLPDVAPKLAQWLEAKIGNELLGKETIRSRMSDMSSIPILQEMANKVKDQLKIYDGIENLMPENIAERQALADKLAMFNSRIDQIKRNDPLPFTDQERAVYSRLRTEAESSRRTAGVELASVATEHGYAVEREGSFYRLRDADSDALVGRVFDTAEKATEFIREAGRPNAIDLDGGGNNLVPPKSVAGHMPPPEPQPRLYEAPHQFAPNTTVTKVMNFLDTVAPWFTTKRQFMTSLDAQFGTKFYEQVYLPMQSAKMKLEAVKRPFLRQVQEVEKILTDSKVTRADWKQVSEYRESMSPNEVVEKYIKGRRLSSNEQTYARKLVNDGIDIPSVYSYTRAVAELERGFNAELGDLQNQINSSQDPMVQMELRKQVGALNESHRQDMAGARAAFNMDDKHMAAHEMFKEIKTKNINEVSLDAVTRLARSLQNNEPSRGEYALKNKMHPKMIEAAQKIDALYSAVAQHLNIDEKLNNYLNHYRRYTQLPDATPASLRDKALQAAAKDMPAIASELIRSGEMNVYEMDPVNALIQYVNSTFAQQHFNPVWKDAQAAAVGHLRNIPRGREAVARVINEYVGGMRGVPAASDELAQLSFNKMLDALQIDVKPEIRKDLINTWLAAQSGAFLGFRPAQGIRDFAQFSKAYYSRFGTARYTNGLKLAFERDPKTGKLKMEQLALDGRIPGLSVLQFASEEELANGIAGKAGVVKDAIFAASEAGLKVSAQHNSYSLAHATAYLDTHDLASKTLLELQRGKITKEVAYKRLSMNSYDIPVAEGFDRLVTDGKMTEAAEYLAQSTGAETAFLFGMGNHPYLWGTNFGRLAGSLGTWSIWDRNFLTRLAGRGTPTERAAAMARLASSEIATGLAGKALGFNMRSWYMIPGMLFGGGPAFAYAEQIQDMMGQRGRLRQSLAKRQLTHAPPGQLPIVSQVTPGAMALSDYFQAWQAHKNRYGVVPVLGKAMGMSLDQTQRSWLDELTDNHPRLKK
jgi:hypothetical protein